MSVDRRIFIGPYLHCKVKTVPHKTTWKECVAERCGRFGSHRIAGRITYCTECGNKLAIRTRTDKSKVVNETFDKDLLEVVDDRLSEICFEFPVKGSCIFIPNRDWPREFCIGRESTGEVLRLDTAAVDSKSETAWFKEAYQEEIEQAGEIYGSDNVDIRWGVLQDYV